MNWLPAIFFGLLTAFIGAAYSGYMADRAVSWLRISSFEGGSGYFVVGMILLGFVGSLVVGVIVCRLTGAPGALGIAKGFGWSVGTVALVISVLGALAWASADREPLVAGEAIDLAVEVRLPPGMPKPEGVESGNNYTALSSGSGNKSRLAYLRLQEAREEGGRWILPGQITIHVSLAPRTLSVRLDGRDTQFFDTPIPAKPAKLDDDWSAWLEAPFLGNLGKPPPEQALAIRYRIVSRPPPPPPEPEPPREPTVQERKQETFAALTPDAPTEEWLDLTTLDTPEHIRKAAIKLVTARPNFASALIDRINSEDPETARDAMYLVGEMEPPPAEVGDAVKARAADVVHIAEAIDPNAEDSRDRLYAEAHVLASGVHAAAFGLRRAGVDIRAELKAMADACRDREKAPPRAIADDAERIIAYFDKLEREGAPMPGPFK